MTLALLGLVFWLAVAVAAALTSLAVLYARRRRMLDEPGQRRSHAVATPRGGGIAIVAVTLLAAAMLWPWAPHELAFVLGLVSVAGVGWIDDHRPLSASVRLLVHVMASALFVSVLPRDGDSTSAAWLVGALQVLLLVGAINFWNFMDGIDGLVASQSLFVALALAALLILGGERAAGLVALAIGGGCLGFLPSNFPRAKIFLGDVGSGGLGFACGALLLQAQASGAITALGALVAMSVIGIDASLTLLSRMARGRRWYHPHREHLYQWLVRRGRSHARVTALYFAWNLVIVLPVLALLRPYPAAATALGVVALAAGTAAWFAGKRRLARRVRA